VNFNVPIAHVMRYTFLTVENLEMQKEDSERAFWFLNQQALSLSLSD